MKFIFEDPDGVAMAHLPRQSLGRASVPKGFPRVFLGVSEGFPMGQGREGDGWWIFMFL